jgi:hypothetical protein
MTVLLSKEGMVYVEGRAERFLPDQPRLEAMTNDVHLEHASYHVSHGNIWLT